MRPKNNETQKAIVFGDLYEKIKIEQRRLGLSTFAETVRYICARYIDEMMPRDENNDADG